MRKGPPGDTLSDVQLITEKSKAETKGINIFLSSYVGGQNYASIRITECPIT